MRGACPDVSGCSRTGLCGCGGGVRGALSRKGRLTGDPARGSRSTGLGDVGVNGLPAFAAWTRRARYRQNLWSSRLFATGAVRGRSDCRDVPDAALRPNSHPLPHPRSPPPFRPRARPPPRGRGTARSGVAPNPARGRARSRIRGEAVPSPVLSPVLGTVLSPVPGTAPSRGPNLDPGRIPSRIRGEADPSRVLSTVSSLVLSRVRGRTRRDGTGVTSGRRSGPRLPRPMAPAKCGRARGGAERGR